MCLNIVYQQPALIAEEPITCYKVLTARKRGHRKLQIISPYYEYLFTLNALHTSELNVKHLKVDNISIVKEGFHSFINKDSALYLIEYFKKYDDYVKIGIEKYVTVECTIPPGSKYYVGNFPLIRVPTSDDVEFKYIPSIASDKIIPEVIL